MPNEQELRNFLHYFQVARTVRRNDRRLFLDFVCNELRSHIAGLPSRRPNFSDTPDFLRSFAPPGASKPLSALSKWVLVANQGTPWTPFDQFVCAALRIRGRGDAAFKHFYSTIDESKWEEICSEFDRTVVPNHGFSIARVFDKFLFLAGSELRERGAWSGFLRHACESTEEERQRAKELADVILASPDAVALLKGLICKEARQALERAHERHLGLSRSGGGA